MCVLNLDCIELDDIAIDPLDSDEAIEAIRIAGIAAEFAATFLFHNHRGVISCGDRMVIYGNDGYAHDPRSRREAEIVMERLVEFGPTIAVDDEGCTWAVVVTDYRRGQFDAWLLDKVVWNAWMIACQEAEESQEALDLSIIDGETA